jgi:hypothetical protein
MIKSPFLHFILRWTHYALVISVLLSLISAREIVVWLNLPASTNLALSQEGAT